MNTEVNNYDNQDLNRNLPVLYTIPKWNLIKKDPNEFCYRFFVPELGKWLPNNNLDRMLRSYLGISSQEYYDRWFLNITVPSDRPKCPCGKLVQYIDANRGYRTFCCKSCSNKYESSDRRLKRGLSLRITNAKPSVITKRSDSAKLAYINRPELVTRASETMTRRWASGELGRPNKEYLKYPRGNRSRMISPYTNEYIGFDSSFERRFFILCTKDTDIVSVSRAYPLRYIISTEEESERLNLNWEITLIHPTL